MLTGLPNRALFLGRLQSVVDRMRRHPQQAAAVLFSDIDDFKVGNDCYGHATGDTLIKEVSNRLRACMRSDGIIARMGGDEFTVLVEDVTDPSDAIRIAERIQSSFARPFLLEGLEVFKSTSIGIALTSPETPAETVLQNADIAMYRAKSQGKDCSELFDRVMHEQVMSRLLLEAKLRSALENEELTLHYQPIVTVDTGAVQGFEALLRWQPSGSNSVPPSTFVPIAEQCGLIVPISVWVLSQACLEAASWRQRYPADPPLYVSINISSKHFSHTGFIGHVKDALQESAIDPQCITIEFTESLAMNDVAATLQTMSQLRALGVKLSIDDFGTGYSSLSYLRRFPVDTLLAAINSALEKNGLQVFEQVADGQAATQIFQSELGGSAGSPISSIRPSIFTADPNLQTSRSEIASAGVERLVTNNLTASATFLFARGVRLSRTRNVNLLPPVVLTLDNAASLGIPNPFPQQLGRLVFPPARLSFQFDNIYQWENHASSVYNGFSLSLNRSLSNEISFSGSYTFSKAIDDASDFNEQPENPYLLHSERALSSNDQRHRFVFSGTFDLPFADEEGGKKAPGTIAKLLANIEAAPILIIGSGRPINPLTGFDGNGSSAFPLSSRPLGFGRNSLATTSQVQLDLRVLKFFKVGEHGKLDFVVESFNLLNHTNVAALNQFYGPESSPIPVFKRPNKAGIPRQLQFSIDFEF